MFYEDAHEQQMDESLLDKVSKHKVYLYILVPLSLVTLLVFFFVYNNNGKGNQFVIEDSSSLDAGSSLFVDLSGSIEDPGVYELPKGSRIADLIVLGGGISNDASRQWVGSNLNLSAVLEDSQKVYIPFEWETQYIESQPIVIEQSGSLSTTVNGDKSTNANASANTSTNTSVTSDIANLLKGNQVSDGATSTSPESSTQVNVNKSDATTLETLSGIGPAYAQRIIDNRPYNALGEFKDKSGVPESTIEKIEPYISF